MVKPTIIEETAIPLSEVREHIDKIKANNEKPNFRVEKTAEYLDDFPPLNEKEADRVIKKLQSLGLSRLKPEQIAKIVDFMPKTPEELSMILHGGNFAISKTDIKQIVTALDEVR